MNAITLTSIIVFWLLAVPAIVGDVLAGRSDQARRVGRICTGLVMLIGGAVVNATSLATGYDYADFADGSKFGWVTEIWRAVVPPHHLLLIGLLVLFEAIVGVLILIGGRWTQLGLVGAIAFHLALGFFLSWFYTGYAAVMLVALVLLLRAERRASASTSVERKSPTLVGP